MTDERLAEIRALCSIDHSDPEDYYAYFDLLAERGQLLAKITKLQTDLDDAREQIQSLEGEVKYLQNPPKPCPICQNFGYIPAWISSDRTENNACLCAKGIEWAAKQKDKKP